MEEFGGCFEAVAAGLRWNDEFEEGVKMVKELAGPSVLEWVIMSNATLP